jgi:hypothetical protein
MVAPPLVLTLLSDEADELRPLLRAYQHAGVSITEQRSWWLWRRFTIAGPAAVMQQLREALDRRETERVIQDAW